MEGDALIRANFHLNPDSLTDTEWVARLQQAIWIEHYRTNLIGRLFSPKE